MTPTQKLDSPIDLPVSRSTILPRTIFTSAPMPEDTRKHRFIKYGSPYDQLNQLFVALGQTWRSIDAIKFKNGLPVGYISHCNFEGKGIPVMPQIPNHISHPSLLIAREIFVFKDKVHLCYEHWGITLDEIEQLWPVFQLSKVEVALICKIVRPQFMTECCTWETVEEIFVR